MKNAVELSFDQSYAVAYNFNDTKLGVNIHFLEQEFTNRKYAETFKKIY